MSGRVNWLGIRLAGARVGALAHCLAFRSHPLTEAQRKKVYYLLLIF